MRKILFSLAVWAMLGAMAHAQFPYLHGYGGRPAYGGYGRVYYYGPRHSYYPRMYRQPPIVIRYHVYVGRDVINVLEINND